MYVSIYDPVWRSSESIPFRYVYVWLEFGIIILKQMRTRAKICLVRLIHTYNDGFFIYSKEPLWCNNVRFRNVYLVLFAPERKSHPIIYTFNAFPIWIECDKIYRRGNSLAEFSISSQLSNCRWLFIGLRNTKEIKVTGEILQSELCLRIKFTFAGDLYRRSNLFKRFRIKD